MKSKYLHVGDPPVTPAGRGSWLAAWWPALAIAAAIFAFSSIPGRDIPTPSLPHVDKLMHLASYLALGAACSRALARSRWASRGGFPSGRWLWLAGAALATLYGATDELHQVLVPGRAPDAVDLLADGVGALLGAGLHHRRRAQRQLPARL